MDKFLREALLKVQESLPHVGKNREADTGKYKYRYVDLETVHDAILPLLRGNGLLWVTWPTMTERGFALHYELSHTSGESVSGDYYLPTGGAQEIGSAITYARRYALVTLTGLTPSGDDDDGAAASGKAPGSFDQAVLRDEWIAALNSADSIAALQAAWEGAGKAGVTGDATVIKVKDKRKAELQ